MKKKELQSLLDQMVQVIHSERNIFNGSLYKQQPPFGRGARRGIPQIQKNGVIPFVVEADTSFWSKIIGLAVAEFWSDPVDYIAGQIKMDLHKFQVLRDNTHFPGEICPWPGVVFELSLFGIPVQWHADRGPWIDSSDPLLKKYEDLDTLEKPDFYKSGLMPRVHEFYGRFQELVEGKLQVVFPEWVYGPFGIAAHLRGMTELLMDTIRNPDWVARLLRFITDAQKDFSAKRSQFIGEPINKIKIYDDEVDCPMVSPKFFENLILPLEKELSDYHGGLVYYHSCGNLTKLLPLIKHLPNLEMLHVGPWTDLGEALNLFTDEIAYDVCLDPVKDIFEADETEMKRRLTTIINALKGKAAFSIRADGFMAQGNETGLYDEKLRCWCELTRRVTGQV